MPATVSIRIKADRAIKKLARFGKAFDEKTLLTIIGDDVLAWIRLNFETEGGLREQEGIGSAWRPLAPSTIAKKGHAQILFETGQLESSFRKRLFGSTVQIFTLDPKAPFHQFGTKSRTVLPTLGEVMVFQGTEGTVFTRRVVDRSIPRRPILPTKRVVERLSRRAINKILELEAKKL